MAKYVDNGPMLNAYPDSIGGTLSDVVSFLKEEKMADTFQSFYILPSVFNSDLDRGFSIIDYNINDYYAKREDIEDLKALGMDLKLDFVLNHISVLSPQFQDILKNGEDSRYKDFFINWNRFWEGKGEMTADGYIQPEKKYIENMFFRKPGLPILMVRFPDGTDVPYWNTFYQEVKYPVLDAQDVMKICDIQYTSADALAKLVNEGVKSGKAPKEVEFGRFEAQKQAVVEYLDANRKYLGQMDINIKSPLAMEYYDNVLATLESYGTKIVRLDAFAYAPKEPGEKNFFNEPGTWDFLAELQKLADKHHLTFLPEIHSSYSEKSYESVSKKGYMTYDFFTPGLVLDAMEYKTGEHLMNWAKEVKAKNIRTVNMLGCHDGIPLLDLKGILPEERIQALIDTVVGRGGFVKDLHGAKNMYYQVNATYYSALGEDDKKMMLARALQLFMPGKPQVWYLDLFAGKNDHEAVKRAGAGGHKEINRTNLSVDEIKKKAETPIVAEQIKLLQFRNTYPAFGFDADFDVACDGTKMTMTWKNNGCTAELRADFADYSYEIVTEG